MKINEIKSNIAVFTTKFVIENDSPILYVTHDEDGDWHFMGDDDITEDDAKLVSIKNILELDQTIDTVPPLEEGYRAVRLSKEGKWKIYKIVD